MGFFDWTAPLFARFGDRWSPEDAEVMAGRLRPFLPEQGCRILDVGGGTGALASHLADATGAHVTVLDATPRMLAYVPDRPDVDAVLGLAESMPFGDGSFDAVVVSDAFHHFADQDAAAGEIVRVTRRGGGILVLELDRRGPVMRLVARVEKLLGEPGTFFTPEEMCAFWAERGVHGECAEESRVTYRFLGRAG